MRRPIQNGRRDKKVFKRTANSIKKINLAPKVMRGGVRL